MWGLHIFKDTAFWPCESPISVQNAQNMWGLHDFIIPAFSCQKSHMCLRRKKNVCFYFTQEQPFSPLSWERYEATWLYWLLKGRVSSQWVPDLTATWVPVPLIMFVPGLDDILSIKIYQIHNLSRIHSLLVLNETTIQWSRYAFSWQKHLVTQTHSLSCFLLFLNC